jgi:hypothetical protein
MIQIEQQRRLASEPFNGLAPFFLVVEIIQHFFDGTWTVETRIYSPVDGAHSTGSHQFLNAIAAT